MSIIIKKLTKTYDVDHIKQVVVDNVSLAIMSSITAIIGESGCGKSTLLNIIAGLDQEYQGSVYIEGNNIRAIDINRFRRDQIGYIFQNFNLIQHLNVYENIALALDLLAIEKDKKKQRVLEALGVVGMEDSISKYPNQLSGGQKQRIAIARAIVKEPKYLLADEPTGSLDQENTTMVLSIFKTLANRGIKIIIVTHSQKVAAFADEVVTLKDDNLIKIEDARQLEISSKNINPFLLAVKNFWEKRKRNIMISIGCAIGLCGLLMMLSISTGTKEYINQELSKFVDFDTVYVSKTFDDDLKSNFRSDDEFTQAEMNYLYNLEGVQGVRQPLSLSAHYDDSTERVETSIQEIRNQSSLELIEGRLPVETEIAINEKFKESIKNYYLGKTIDLETTYQRNGKLFKSKTRHKIVGVVKNQSLIGISVNTIHMSKEGIKTTINEAGVRIKISTLEVVIDPLYREETIEILKEKYDVDDAKELLDTIYSYLLIVSTILGVFALVALTVSSIMIYITTHINVVERTKEIGILKSLGFVKSEILFLFLIESVLTGLISSIICITLTELISLLINQITQDLFTFSFVVVEMKAIISIVLLGVTLSSLSGFKPALNASRKDAVEALRFE